jgi:hypothetical protein
VAHSLYKFTAVLHKALYVDTPRDLLLSNEFFSITRKWSFEELAYNATIYASEFGITLSEHEKIKLCSSVCTMENLFNSTALYCKEKLERVSLVPTPTKQSSS